MNDRWFATSVAGGGLLAGLLLWLLSVAVSHAHITGNGWSLAGNGILIIPFGLGPAIVSAAWAAIILRLRCHPRWLELGLGSGLIGLLLLLGSFLSLVLFGARNRDLGATGSLFFGFLLYGWILGSGITAGLVPAPDPPRAQPPWWSIAAMLLMPVTLIAGCEAGAGILPAS
ncbi:MAG TPA: hypothetical protein VIT43_02745 [Candidatus Dormibacteraeota bacterium]